MRIQLNLPKVIQLALENSFEVQLAKYQAYIEQTNLAQARSIFDTFLSASSDYDYDRTEKSSSLSGSRVKSYGYSVGLEKKIPTGTEASIIADSSKTSSDSSFVEINPGYQAQAQILLEQPLARNFFGLSDRSDIKMTKIDIKNSDSISLDTIAETVYQAQKVYWQLVLAKRRLEIRKQMLAEAQKLYEVYQKKRRLGLVEEPELLAVKALVKQRNSDIQLSLLEVDNNKNELLYLLNIGSFKDQVIVDDNLRSEKKQLRLTDLLTQAINNRRDYQRIKNDIEKNKLNLVVKKNALWPELDLTATFIRNNIEGTTDAAWNKIEDQSNDQIVVGIKFKVPLEQNKEKAQLKAARLNKSSLLLALKKAERNILKEINNKFKQAKSYSSQIDLYQQIVVIHEDKLRQQVQRINRGRSDADTLVRYEQDLLDARLGLAKAWYDYRISLLELEIAQNILLDKYWQGSL